MFKGGEQLGVQIVGGLAILAWTLVNSYIMFKVIDMVIGLRVSSDTEAHGLDSSEHGGSAYNMSAKVTVVDKAGAGSEMDAEPASA